MVNTNRKCHLYLGILSSDYPLTPDYFKMIKRLLTVQTGLLWINSDLFNLPKD